MPSLPKAPSWFFASRPPSTASPWCQCQHFCFCKSGFSAPTLSSVHGWHFCLYACHIPKGKVHHGSNTAERWTKGKTKIRLWDLEDHRWCGREHFYEMSREAILGSYVLYTQPKITSLTSNLFIFCCYSFYPIFKFLLLINSKSQSLSCFPSYLYYTVVSYVSSIYGGSCFTLSASVSDSSDSLSSVDHTEPLHFEMHVCSVTQSCLTICNPMDCNPQGSSAHGIFQARILERVSIFFSRGSSRPRD